ncbi:MAG: molybdopterin molybdotransferase MoeA [Flavobacteriaceae bacterium]|nr:molybdopterin molybdotransferase MoeA [Flavobacteriaceae bacterium]
MISVEQAIQIVKKHSKTSVIRETIPVSEALGYTLVSDIVSPINMPPFRQSAMDGYALNIHDNLVYTVVGEVKAGDGHEPSLNPGEAVRIFTGAPVPETANAVIMQEKTTVENAKLTTDELIALNANIRPLGEQVLKGDDALNKGTKLTPAALAYLTSLGITEVGVYKKPSIAIVVTGNELAKAGQDLQYGQIYESNAVMLNTALRKSGYTNVSLHKVEDDYQRTYSLLKRVIQDHDVVLVSGGISVGDYDFVGKALKELGVQELFYKVKQKPGKPLFFGEMEGKIIFALPGNPAAALSCFYMYVLLALERISGNEGFSLPKLKAKSNSNFIKKGDRGQFLKAVYNGGSVNILEGQNSSMLHTFALANAMVVLDEKDGSVRENDMLDVILLPI